MRLDLSNNQLDELPPAIAQLAALQHLDLSNNALKALLPEYGKLESLTHVNVSHNQITSLPVGARARAPCVVCALKTRR